MEHDRGRVRGRVREFAAAALWALLALGWVLAVVLPWYTAGILSGTSLLGAGQVLRSGALPVPSSAAYGVLVLPVLAAILLALALARGIVALLVRLVALLLGTGLIITLIVLLSDAGAGSWALGLWSAVLGSVAGVVALCISTVRTGTRIEAPPGRASEGVLAGPYARPGPPPQ